MIVRLLFFSPSFLCLDEFVPVEPLVRHSERFATVALDAVLGHQLFERRSDLRERHFVFIDTAFG